jgi:MFS family permease
MALMPTAELQLAPPRSLWGFTGYQWLVIAAAWLGWGFDVFDGLLFNYVARACLPDLLHLDMTDKSSEATITLWTGTLTSVLLVGWGFGGIIFGKICDKIGRSKALLITMLLYSLATAGCAFSQNIWMLVFFRVIASLGIGGEWAAGASLVAETVPENKRVAAGMLLYSSSPFGILLATFVSDLFLHKLQLEDPHLGWRLVFLSGLVPAAVAFLIRIKVKEPPMWKPDKNCGRIGDLFSPTLLRRTIGGLAMAVIALLAWWSCFAFLPLLGQRLAIFAAGEKGQIPLEQFEAARKALVASFVSTGTNAYSLGGLLGTLLTLPIAIYLGRRWMFALYFGFSAIAVYLAFGGPFEPMQRMYMMFPVGVGVFGVFGAFTFYLPELFPTRLRSTGAGFCYNTGRFIAAAGPFIIGALARQPFDTPQEQLAFLLKCVSWVAVFPALGVILVLLGVAEETKGKRLADHG